MTVDEMIIKSYGNMSKLHKKIARYISQHPFDAMFDSVAVLAKKAETSDATIVRFAYALGFAGFTDMQKHLQKDLSGDKKPSKTVLISQASEESSRLHELMYNSIDLKQLKAAAEIIMTCENLVVVGYMDSFGIASQFVHLMYVMRKNVTFSRFIFVNEWESHVNRIGKNAAAIIVSFSPHYQYTYNCLKDLKKIDAKLISITDSYLSPYSGLVDHEFSFLLSRNKEYDFVDPAPVMSFVHYLAAYLTQNYKTQIDEYRANSLMKEEVFLE